MKRVVAVGLAILVAGGVLLVPVAGAGADEARPAVRKMLVVLLPGLRWADVDDQQLPNLERLFERSAIASNSVRSIGAVTLTSSAYTTIGAGNRAGPGRQGLGRPTGGLALDGDEPIEQGTARDALGRRCGCDTTGSAVVHLDVPLMQEINHRFLYGARPGALGRALARAGRRVGVVGNADRSLDATVPDRHREVALAAVDADGRVPVGTVSGELLEEDPAAPFGVRFDEDAVVAAVRGSLEQADVVFVEASDLARADALRGVASPAGADRMWATAVRETDRLVGRLLGLVDLDRDMVLTVGPTSPATTNAGTPAAELTVFSLAGPGIERGAARSATTRRRGYVTLPDIGPTVLDAFGIDEPRAMNGTPIISVGGSPPSASTFAIYAERNERTVFRDRVTGPVSVTFIVFQVLVYLAAALALSRFRGARRILAPAALVTLALPTVVFLSKAVPYYRLGPVGYVLALFAAAGVLAALALLAGRALARRAGAARPLLPPLLLVGLLLTVLLVDGVVGAPLQLDTVFGYSPTVAGRFTGYGNLAFGMLAAAAILVASGLWGIAVLRARRGPTRLAALLLLVVVVVDGFPSWGSDVGGVLALVPATFVLVLLLAGHRIDLRRAVLAATATLGVLAAFAAVDLSRPAASRTHLGRLAARLVSDDGGFATILRRKLEANVHILTSSVWTWVMPFAILFLAFLLRQRPGRLRNVEDRIPGLRSGLVAATVAGALGFALNDSGIAVPAVMLAVVLPYLTYLVLETAELPP
jgi:hypothetical protein